MRLLAGQMLGECEQFQLDDLADEDLDNEGDEQKTWQERLLCCRKSRHSGPHFHQLYCTVACHQMPENLGEILCPRLFLAFCYFDHRYDSYE